ncbi:TRAP transporter small permease subunit [Mammaliicoccus sciuri]|uniref:TRAP-type C4-dicarboxylate transport system, small permease component n=1 Tax=Sporosarcina newyorkensis TaxID=759851 RepID=A0A1T4XZ20_9BACL|nr:TRAP transporter small permease subunit [Sporosarcina newyorkensis]SKA94804.1 TRAP-type C4-dicarboxylate transport system, small permease component [Sporosarcina newyorkensis]
MAPIKKGFEKIEKICLVLSAAALFIMMVWIFADVIMRYFFNSPIAGTMEITSEYFMVIIVYLGISYTLKHNGHVKVDLLESKLSKSFKVALSIFKDLLVLIILGLMLVSNINLFFDYYERGITSVGSIEYLLAPAFLVMALGVLMVIARLIFNVVESISSLSKQEVNEETTVINLREEAGVKR